MPQPIDYDALAQTHGGQAAPAARAGGGVDYDALARQHGAIVEDAGVKRPNVSPKASDDEIISSLGYDPKIIKSSKLYQRDVQTNGSLGGMMFDASAGPVRKAEKMVLNSWAGDLGMGILDIPLGLGQLAAHGAHKLGLLSDADQQYADLFFKMTNEDFRQNVRDGNANPAVRLAGNVIAPLPGSSLIKGVGVLGKMGKAAVSGAIGSASQPVEAKDGESYWQEKTKQVATGAALGGAFSGAVNGGVATVRKVGSTLVERALASSETSKLPQQAVDLAEQLNVPLNQGARTGSRAVQAAEKTLGETIAPDKYAAMIEGQQKGLHSGAEALVGKAPSTKYEAGDEILGKLTRKQNEVHQKGRDAYDAFEVEAAATPFNSEQTAGLPVNISSAKKALQPTFDRIKELLERIPEASRERDPGYRWLSRLMNGPDVRPAAHAEELLSQLKQVGRDTQFPELQSRSQAIANAAVSVLQPAIDRELKLASPKALTALQEGRARWAEQHGIAELMQRLGGATEGAQLSAVAKLTSPKDKYVDLLKQVLETAPEAADSLRRGYLTDLFEKPTANGGFTNVAKALSDWNKLGPQTKRAIFGEQTADIDTFFKLADRLNQNPNPSGTGTVNALLKMGLLVTNPQAAVPTFVFGRKLADVLYTTEGAKSLSTLLVSGPTSKAGLRAYRSLGQLTARESERKDVPVD